MKVVEKILVVDINYLTEDYKVKQYEDIKTLLSEEYNCLVILIDSSKQNVQGSSNNTNPPVYFT